MIEWWATLICIILWPIFMLGAVILIAPKAPEFSDLEGFGERNPYEKSQPIGKLTAISMDQDGNLTAVIDQSEESMLKKIRMQNDKKFAEWLGKMLLASGENQMLENMWDAYKAGASPESVAALGRGSK